MAEPNSPVQTSPGNGQWAFVGRLGLAILALLAYVLVAESFSLWPPKLVGTDASNVLTTLQNLTVMAFSFFFHGALNSK